MTATHMTTPETASPLDNLHNKALSVPLKEGLGKSNLFDKRLSTSLFDVYCNRGEGGT